MSKSLIIIGGGIAGLSAGCYAQMNGFNSEIYEMHNIAGGLCTAWQRKGFTFDLCIHWLVGSSPKSKVHALWEELGLVQDKQFINYAFFRHALDERGNRFIGYTNPDELREHMLSFSPEDERLITAITNDIKKLMSMDIPIDYSIRDLIAMFSLLLMFRKYSMPVSELAAQFTNPVLRNLFRCAFDWHDQSAISVLLTLALMGSGNASYPIGGSRPLAQSIEERYLTLGGTISYKSQVEKILVEDGTAVGIRLADGTEKRGDIVLSAADGYTTIFKWLDGRYINNRIKGFYETLEPFPPLVFVSLGINDDYSQETHWLSFPLKTPIELGGEEIQRLWLRNHSMDKALAPEGKTVFSLMIPTNYGYWVQLKDKKDEYLAEKKRIEEAVVNAISELYPDVKSKVEVVDVATPLTFVRHTGNWRGSYEGWLRTKKTMSLPMPLTLPGLSHFYMAGHWVSPGGGLPAAAITGRAAVKLMCKNEKMHFVTTRP
jgi:phytoene dehydrogenase-like protein